MAESERPTNGKQPAWGAELAATKLGLDDEPTHERDPSRQNAIADHRELAESAGADHQQRHWPRIRQPDIGPEALEADHEAEPTRRRNGWGWEP